MCCHIYGPRIDDLLDADRPHLSTWVWVRRLGPLELLVEATFLYSVVELGFRGIVEYLISKRPQDRVCQWGQFGTPLHGVLHQEHTGMALL